MGKNHRHKKHLKSEKAKTKLKGQKTKFLPKGQNVTDTSFKIKPIVLPEQLKIKEDEVLSSRKLNLKEILNRLNHYNTTVKYENCEQLKELICSSGGEIILKQNISKILTSLCPLILDIEQKVRREAIKALDGILRLCNSSEISSFFDVISSFLRCSMTHINQNVQEDSLLLLDTLLLHIPDLLAKNCSKILVNFFTLISKLKNGSKSIRTLAENLNSKYTGAKWRIQVLFRLKRIFEAMYNNKKASYTRNQSIEKIVDCTQTNAAPLYYDRFANCLLLSDNTTSTGEDMVNYIDTLLPLLNETWLEVNPHKMNYANTGELNFTMLKLETSTTLYCLLGILYILYQLAEMEDKENKITLHNKMRNKTYRSMFNSILKSFPYMKHSEKQHKKDNSMYSIHEDPKCIRENLLICYLFSVQNNKIKETEVLQQGKKILDYLKFCLLNRKYIEKEQTKLMLSIIKIILENNLRNWKEANLSTDTLIESALHYYLHNNCMTDDDGTELFFILYNIADPLSEKQELMAEKACNFLLSREISSKALDSLSLLVKKNVGALHDSLRNNLKGILGNLTVTGNVMKHIKINRILCLFYYISLNQEDLQVLDQFGRDNPEIASTISCIINSRSSNK